MVTIPRPGLYYDTGGLLDPFKEGYDTSRALRTDVANVRAGNALLAGDYQGAAREAYGVGAIDAGQKIQEAQRAQAEQQRKLADDKRKEEAAAHAQVAAMLNNVRQRTKDPATLMRAYENARSYLSPYNTDDEINLWGQKLQADPEATIAGLGVSAAKQGGVHVVTQGDEVFVYDTNDGHLISRTRADKAMAAPSETDIVNVAGSHEGDPNQSPVGGAPASAVPAGSTGQDAGAGAVPPPPEAPPSDAVLADRRARIAAIETRGQADPYAAVGRPTRRRDGSIDRPLGKYQVMESNLAPWTQEVLGRSMTPQEFLANPKAQDAVFDSKFHEYVQKYGSEEDAASAWFTGGPRSQGAGKRDNLGTTGAQYVSRFSQGRPTAPAAPPAQPPNALRDVGVVGQGGAAPGSIQVLYRGRPKAQARPATPEEKKAYGVAADVPAQIKADGTFDVISGTGAALKRIPAQVQSGYVDNRKAITQIDSAIALIQKRKDALGLKNKLGDDINQRLDPEGIPTRAAVANIGSLLIHDRSGAAVTAAEQPRLMPFIPSVTDTADAAVKKLQLLKEQYQATNDEIDIVFGQDAGYAPMGGSAKTPPPGGAAPGAAAGGGAPGPAPTTQVRLRPPTAAERALTQEALAKGVPRAQVIARLRKSGIDPKGV